MKKLIIPIILLSISLLAIAEYFEINGKIPCDDTNKVFTVLIKEHKELPIWQGDMSETAKAVLLVNSDSLSWSFILVSGKSTCVINTGKGYAYRVIDKGPSI